MPITTAQAEARTQDPKTLGQDILAFLREMGKRYRTYQLAQAFGLSDDAGWERFQAALKTIPARMIIRVRGQGGFVEAVVR